MIKLSLYPLFALLITGMTSCQKDKYSPYIGEYDCSVSVHFDSVGINVDSSYTELAEIYEVDSKTIQFKDLPIPYKFIREGGHFEDENFVSGLIWGRQITLRNDSLIYFHHESGGDFSWWMRYKGKRL